MSAQTVRHFLPTLHRRTGTGLNLDFRGVGSYDHDEHYVVHAHGHTMWCVFPLRIVVIFHSDSDF
jgi:hypothetical protein